MKKLFKWVVTFVSQELLNKENAYLLSYDPKAERWRITKKEAGPFCVKWNEKTGKFEMESVVLAEDRPKIPRINEESGEA